MCVFFFSPDSPFINPVYKCCHCQIGVTFAIVFGVILYRISTKAALHMSSNPITRNHVQLTVKTTAAIINLVVILILDEVYGAVARWLTVLGKSGLVELAEAIKVDRSK